jgi:vacuolar-type H+-ATPase subunit H
MENTFNEIRAIEKESEEIISAAEAKKEHTIASAKKEADRAFSENSQALKKHIEEETEKLGKDSEAARQKVINANRKKIEALKKSAAANSGEAVEIVLKKFERLFG